MDPNATLQRIIDSVQAQDRDELRSACVDLVTWLDRAGFMPNSLTREDFAEMWQMAIY